MPDTESLRWKFLSDTEAQRLYRRYPKLRASYEEFCPTCDTHGQYFWDGRMQVCDCQLQLQLHKHYLSSGVGVTYQRLDWADYHADPLLLEEVQGYVRDHANLVSRGVGLNLHGPYGTGKTFVSTLLLKDLIKLGHQCFSTTFMHMVEMFTAGWREPEEQKYFETKIIQSDVLLLDDLGRETKTKIKLSETTFDDVLRRRVQDGRPTLLTTNKSIAELEEGYGGAVLSLICESSLYCEVPGVDYRPKSARRLRQEMEDGLVRPIF